MFLQGNVPLRHLQNGETLFMSGQRSAIKEVNDWTLNQTGFLNSQEMLFSLILHRMFQI